MNVIGVLERSSKVIHNTCSFAASQLATIGKFFIILLFFLIFLDVDGFSSSQMKEMLHSSVEKFVGSTDSLRAYSLLTYFFKVIQ